MAVLSPKLFILAVVVAAVVLVQLGIVGRHRMISQLLRCDCRSSDGQASTTGLEHGNADDIPGRLRRIKTYCEKYAGILQAEDRWDDASNKSTAVCTRGPQSLYIVDTRHFAFCAVPKAATSSIKALILAAENVSAKVRDADGIFRVFRRRFRFLCPSTYVRDRVVANYTKVVIVRHPFERLVSAYLNKVRTTKPMVNGAKEIYKDGFRGSGPNGTFTFGEFVKIILKAPVDSWDPHWAPYTTRCRPCTMRYDVIVKVETLERDLGFLLRKIGLAGWSFPKKNAKSDTKDASGDSKHYLAELTRQQMLQLHAIYMYDFELFGYSLKDYTTPVL